MTIPTELQKAFDAMSDAQDAFASLLFSYPQAAPGEVVAPDAVAPARPPLTDAEINRRFAEWTLNKEGRRDELGRLKVYPLPPGDGGGLFEVAGINDRYHPTMAARLKTLIEASRFDQAEQEARDYLHGYTDAVDEWHPDEFVEGLLRCLAFNRGAKGAAWMLQYALCFGFYPSLYPREAIDGAYGPNTRRAAYSAEAGDAGKMLFGLFGARVVYERTDLPWKGSRTEESNFWHGLFRRFVEDAHFAESLRSA